MTTLPRLKKFILNLFLSLYLLPSSLFAVYASHEPSHILVEEGPQGLGFKIPNLGQILTFLIRLFFVLAGVFALIYLLLGAFAWVTSGGNKENVEKARDKIQAALVGVLLIVIVVAIVATLENVVFDKKLCFGLTCDLTLPTLLK